MTTTSYAILGLLAIKPWTTYELVAQVERSLRRFWSRAQSKLYEEPKKLVALGYARAVQEHEGRRPRTRYAITPAGRRALKAWLAEPGAGPELEFEQLVKIHFTDSGTKQDILANLAATIEWAHQQNVENLATGRRAIAGESPFPQRAAINHLVGGFLTSYYTMVAEWARWATSVVQTWPDNPTEAQLDPRVVERIVRDAEALDRLTSMNDRHE